MKNIKRNRKKKLLAMLVPLAFLSLATGCAADGVNDEAQNGYVELTIKRTSSGNVDGYQTYRFDVAPNGSDKIYAGKCTADDNANVDQYIIRALDDTDMPFNAVEVHVTPAKTAEGETYAAKATVRLAQYYDDYAEQDTGFFWTITASDHGLSNENCHIPTATGGIFTFDFQTSDKDGVYEAGYNNNTSNYPLLSVKLAAPTKRY